MLVLAQQTDKAMRVFRYKAGAKNYKLLIDEGLKIWSKLADKHSNTLEHDETEVFIALMSSLIPQQDYKNFLGVKPLVTNAVLDDELQLKVCNSLLTLNDEVNNLLKTKSPIYNIIRQKAKIKKVKEKVISKGQLKHEMEVKKEADRLERKRVFLASLKKRVENINEKKLCKL